MLNQGLRPTMLRPSYFYLPYLQPAYFNENLKNIRSAAATNHGNCQAQFTRAELQVSGLNCALCAKSTERSLRALPFVGDVKPDPAHNMYLIIFKDNQPVNFDLICKKMRDEGFFVDRLKATFNFANVKVAG